MPQRRCPICGKTMWSPHMSHVTVTKLEAVCSGELRRRSFFCNLPVFFVQKGLRDVYAC